MRGGKKQRGRPSKKPKTDDTGSTAATATRAFADAAKTEAARAKQTWQKAQRAYVHKREMRDKLIREAGPAGNAKVEKAKQDVKEAALQHDKSRRAMNIAEDRCKELDSVATSLEAVLDS